MTRASPLVSVIVPARDEETSIDQCLDAILRQTFGDLEVIVVDGGSVDRTRHKVARRASDDSRIRILDNPEQTIPAALNIGLEHARGDFFVRIDAHAVPRPDYVERIVDHLRRGGWAGVGGRKNAVGGDSPWGLAIAAALNSPLGVGGSRYHYSDRVEEVEHVPFGAYPVALLRELGGWDPRLLVNQDFELDYRVRSRGGRILFDPAIWTDWKCSATVSALARQYSRYGEGKAVVATLHPSSLRLRQVAPPVLVATLAGFTLAAPWRPAPLRRLSGAYLGLHLAGVMADHSVLSLGTRIRRAVATGVMHLTWGFGFWRGLLRRTGWRRDPFAARDLSHRA